MIITERNKTPLISCMGVFLLFVSFLLPRHALAVAGACSGCHTMHDSQNGAVDTNYDGTTGAAVNNVGTVDALLNTDCFSCHTGTNTATTVGLGDEAYAPYVDRTTAPVINDTALAGGDFYWVGTDDSFGHNVLGVDTGVDANMGGVFTPPGWDTNLAFSPDGITARGGTIPWATQLTCAGVNGCHGTVAAGITGSHHKSNYTGSSLMASAGNVSDVGDHYRFLEGIKGYEDAKWQFDVDAGLGNINVYSGEVRGAAGVNLKSTISFLCAECHGDFHANDGGAGISGSSFASPWIRHPVDIDLGDAGGEYVNYITYDYTVPLAFDMTDTAYDTAAEVIAANVQGGSGTGGIVTCLSCHFAHGGPYKDILRWDYSLYTTTAVGGVAATGCFKCHRDKDGV